MPTRTNVRGDVDSLLGDDPNITDTELNTLIQLRYASIYESWLWSRRLREFTIALVAQVSSVSTNLVTVTVGSSTVTSAGTPFTSAMAGRAIQIGADPMYYFVNSFTSSSEIVLGNGEGAATNWVGATNTASSWRIFQTIYSLPSDADTVLSLSVNNLDVPELDGGRPSLDTIDPNRVTTGADPLVWCYAGETATTSIREIEVWPVPSAAKLVRGQFARTTPTLAADTDEIGLPRSLMVYGVASDACNMLFHKTGDQSWGDRAVFFERKYKEEEDKHRAIDLERLSPPRSIGRRAGRVGGLVGTDFAITHDLDAMGM